MARITILTTTRIKKAAGIHGNTNDLHVTRAIKDAESLYLLPVLGQDKYDELVQEVTDETVSPENRELIDDYIEDFIAYWVLHDLAFILNHQQTNTGQLERSNQNGQATDNEETYRSMRHYKNKAEAYGAKLREKVDGCESESDEDYTIGLVLTGNKKQD